MIIEMMTRRLSWRDLAVFVGVTLFVTCAILAGIPLILVLGMDAGVVLIAYGVSR